MKISGGEGIRLGRPGGRQGGMGLTPDAALPSLFSGEGPGDLGCRETRCGEICGYSEAWEGF